MTIGILLLMIAALLFLAAAIGVPRDSGRISLGWLGAFFASLALLAPVLG